MDIATNVMDVLKGRTCDFVVNRGSPLTFTFIHWVLHKHPLLVGSQGVMGRSVPSWRMRVENELQNLAPYRRALTPMDREAFDALLNEVRERRTAGDSFRH